MLSKTYLVGYKMDKFQPLNSGHWHFTMSLKRIWLWGMFSTKGEVSYLIPEHHSFTVTTDHWDKLIKDGKSIK